MPTLHLIDWETNFLNQLIEVNPIFFAFFAFELNFFSNDISSSSLSFSFGIVGEYEPNIREGKEEIERNVEIETYPEMD